MNLTKREFKKQYSDYRKSLNDSYYLGKESFINQLNSNSIFRSISFKLEKPVSVAIYLYKNKL